MLVTLLPCIAAGLQICFFLVGRVDWFQVSKNRIHSNIDVPVGYHGHRITLTGRPAVYNKASVLTRARALFMCLLGR